jgi:hypothetical protein
MPTKRNGFSSCIFEASNVIFVFGGMNMEDGLLDSIEKYDIKLDIWYKLQIKLLNPIADFVAQC